jgi:hypothetical protein
VAWVILPNDRIFFNLMVANIARIAGDESVRTPRPHLMKRSAQIRRPFYFAGSRRAVQLTSAGWQAIPMFEQLTVSSASLRHERH